MSSPPPDVPIAPADRDTAPWWAATQEGRLLLQTCDRCGHRQHPPRALCAGCGGADLGWAPATGRGTVYSFTEVHRAPGPGHNPPYLVALVRLEEGPVLLTRLTRPAGCDAPVTLAWQPLPDGRQLPVFTPVED